MKPLGDLWKILIFFGKKIDVDYYVCYGFDGFIFGSHKNHQILHT
jgi:hypothetical protein